VKQGKEERKSMEMSFNKLHKKFNMNIDFDGDIDCDSGIGTSDEKYITGDIINEEVTRL
jgi:hypothetical protein